MNNPKVEILEDGRRVKLIEQLRCVINKHINGYWVGSIFVPTDFVSDFASTPRLLWCILPPWGRYCVAVICHDYLYSTQYVGPLNRADADLIMKILMEKDKVKRWKIETMYRGVRIGGRKYYKK